MLRMEPFVFILCTSISSGITLFDLPGRLQKDVLHSDSVFIALARDARNLNLAASLSDLCAQENVLCDIRFHQLFS